jgi:hypothetical protein
LLVISVNKSTDRVDIHAGARVSLSHPPTDHTSRGVDEVYKLREMGLSPAAFERVGGVGGTWCWNRYQGVSSDCESWVSAYSFSEALEQE